MADRIDAGVPGRPAAPTSRASSLRRAALRGGSSALRAGSFADPVAVVGVCLSVVGSVVLDLSGVATGVESFLACLMGITISLVIDASARSERRFRLRSVLSAAPWLDEILLPIIECANDVQRRYPDTVIADEARNRFERLQADLEDLRSGRLLRPRGNEDDLLTGARTSRRTLQAVTNTSPGAGPGIEWWTTDIGRHYWRANVEALGRGVAVTRIFVYTELTPELRALARVQAEAGVRVGLVSAAAIEPRLRINLAVFDGTSAWEAGLNAAGQIVANTFTVNERDVARLTEAFQLCWMAAEFPVAEFPVVERDVPA